MTSDTSKHDQRRLSFTTLVIVSVLVVGFIAIIIPALGSARVNPRWMQDISNLRAISLAMQSYAQDHDGLYPPNVRLLSEHDYYSEEYFISNADPVLTMRGYIGEEPPTNLYQYGSYIFFPTNGVRFDSIDAPEQFVLAYSPPYTKGKKGGKDHPTVFLDGHAKMLNYEELWNLLVEQTAMLEKQKPTD